MVEPLESRMLLSASTQVMGFLPDYEIAGGCAANFSEKSQTDGTVVHDGLNWSGLTQVDYFALLPQTNTPFVNLSTTPISEIGRASCRERV